MSDDFDPILPRRGFLKGMLAAGAYLTTKSIFPSEAKAAIAEAAQKVETEYLYLADYNYRLILKHHPLKNKREASYDFNHATELLLKTYGNLFVGKEKECHRIRKLPNAVKVIKGTTEVVPYEPLHNIPTYVSGLDPKKQAESYQEAGARMTLSGFVTILQDPTISIPEANIPEAWESWYNNLNPAQKKRADRNANHTLKLVQFNGVDLKERPTFWRDVAKRMTSMCQKIIKDFTGPQKGYPISWFMDVPAVKNRKDDTLIFQVWADGKIKPLNKEDKKYGRSLMQYQWFRRSAYYERLEKFFDEFNSKRKPEEGILVPILVDDRELTKKEKKAIPKEKRIGDWDHKIAEGTYNGVRVYHVGPDGISKDVTEDPYWGMTPKEIQQAKRTGKEPQPYWIKTLGGQEVAFEKNLLELFVDRKNDQGYYFNMDMDAFYRYQLSDPTKPHVKIDHNTDPAFRKRLQPAFEASKGLDEATRGPRYYIENKDPLARERKEKRKSGSLNQSQQPFSSKESILLSPLSQAQQQSRTGTN